MKISELISILEKKKETEGDINVLANGHPGEYGCEIEESDFLLKNHEGVKTLFISF